MCANPKHPLANFGCRLDLDVEERKAPIARMDADRNTRRAALATLRAERVARHIAEDAARRGPNVETPLFLMADD
jgi:hypothetical protein